MKTTTRRHDSHAGSASPAWLLVALLLAVTAAGCSFKRVAVNKLGDALSGGGNTFASDEDPELVKAAVPFSLKLMESLLAESPQHRGLLSATASGFTQYAYAFVQQDADELEEKDFAAAEAMHLRARRLFLRARNYGLRGLEGAHPGFEKNLRADPKAAVAAARRADVTLLYWTGAAWAAAIAQGKDQPALLAELPLMEALIDRAAELDESFGHGALHSFLIVYEGSRVAGTGDPEARSRQHFARAIELSGGGQAAPYVALAETSSVKNQNLAEFQKLLRQALAVDPDARPEWRLANLVAQRRARWLLGRTDQLFLVPEPAAPR